MPKLTTQLDLAGRTCVDQAVDYLRFYEPPEGYYLCFSGGKDSVALKGVADIAGVRYEAWYNVTTIDPPPVLRLIRQAYPDVGLVVPKRSFAQALVRQGFPVRRQRWCCREFKHGGGRGRLKLFGIRKAERRASLDKGRGVVRLCSRSGERAIQPLWHWSTMEVWSFIRAYDLPYCRLYDEGFSRLGCVCCPFASAGEICRNRARWPWMFRPLRVAFHARWAAHWSGTDISSQFASADDLFEWWLTRGIPMPKTGALWRFKHANHSD